MGSRDAQEEDCREKEEGDVHRMRPMAQAQGLGLVWLPRTRNLEAEEEQKAPGLKVAGQSAQLEPEPKGP